MNDGQRNDRELSLEEVRQRQRELDQLKDSFVALVSHELRTPVNLISGFLDLGIEALDNEDMDPGEYLELARKNTARVVRVVQELTDFARLQRGQSVTHLAPIRVDEALHQVIDLLKPNLEQKNLKLDIQLPDEVGRLTYDGESQIIMLRNVISNAAKFSPPDQTILVKGRISGQHVRLSVRDFAQPIPENKQEMIFDDFRQVENYLTRRYEGMGLGLAVARRTARFLGGDILLDVMEDGNIFTIVLPAPLQ
jgi:hypothetical protein